MALEDDSSYGEVVLRQDFDNGNGLPVSRIIARHLVAGDLGPAEGIDGLSFPVVEGADNPQLGMDLRGRGMASGTRMSSLTPTSAFLRNDAFAPGAVLGSLNNGGTDPQTVTAAGQNLTGVVAWLQAPTPAPDGVVVAGRFSVKQHLRGRGPALARRISAPWPTNGGLFAASSRVGDSIVAFAQGPSNDRRVVASVYARFPGHVDPAHVARRAHKPAAAALAAGDVGVGLLLTYTRLHGRQADRLRTSGASTALWRPQTRPAPR